MSSKKNTQVMTEFEDDFRLENLLRKFWAKWYWFVASILVCFGIAYYIAQKQTPLYLVSAKVQINDPKRGGQSAETQLLGELGSMASASVANESEILQTRYLMESVVTDLKLNITYYQKGSLRNAELYTPPFVVDIVEPIDTIRGRALEVSFAAEDKISIQSDVMDTTVAYNKPFKLSGVGTVQILKSEAKPAQNTTYVVGITSVDKVVESLQGNFIILPGTAASVINLTLNYPVPKKGEDILNRLLKNYVETNVNDRNRLADSAYAFIQARLQYLGGELGSLESNIQGFRQRNKITEMSKQSSELISNSSQYLNELAKVETQLSVLSSLEDYMRKNAKGSSIVPSSLVVSDPLFSNLVEKHNSLILERDRRLMSVTETNPIIVNLNQQIASTNSDMLASLNSSKNSLGIIRNRLMAQLRNVEGQVQEVPKNERNYLDLARQQKIKEELFIFLMQKGEETAISKTYNTPNSTNIDPPKSGTSPISPNKMIYYAAGILMGLLIPAGSIYGQYLLNSKIDTKADIVKRTSVPVIAEIGHSGDVKNLIVGNMTRSAIAEQFRALRTNLSFYINKPKGNLILVTSGSSGEGKSFASINLGNVLALSGKKVLLMELDLRKPSLSTKFGIDNQFGFTNFVNDTKVLAKDVIRPLSVHENMYIISSGDVPTNPAEMLLSSRAGELIEELRTMFDFIIIDAPPVGVVTDAQLLGEYADFCLYVVRHNYTQKAQLEIVEDLNANNRMKQLGILVNDIKTGNGNSYGYGYGYNYGSYGHEDGRGVRRKFNSLFKKS
jgi:tyrosine-protein kinase Etk/Wzc